jgi:hypothetical protein
VASHLGWQAAWQIDGSSDTPRRRAYMAPAADPEFSCGKQCGQATHNLLYYPTKCDFREALRPHSNQSACSARQVDSQNIFPPEQEKVHLVLAWNPNPNSKILRLFY